MGLGMVDNSNTVDVVVLDDDVDLLTSIAELLADAGYKVKGFADPESAVEFAVDRRFKVGVFDFRLGRVCHEAVRQNRIRAGVGGAKRCLCFACRHCKAA